MLCPDEQNLQRRSSARNETIFGQGDIVTAIYFVGGGGLRLERRTFDGRLLILGITPANQFFVEAALFSESFHCDAVATESSRVRIYPKTPLLTSLSADPTSSLSFLRLIAHQGFALRHRLGVSKARS